MLPFRVQCETCQTMLQVKHEKVVGQIHPCPKCGGMVQLTPPSELSEEGSPGVADEITSAPVTSPAEAHGRGIALAVAGGGMALVVTAVGVGLMLRGGEEPPPVSALPAEQAETSEAPPSEPTLDSSALDATIVAAPDSNAAPEPELTLPELPADEPPAMVTETSPSLPPASQPPVAHDVDPPAPSPFAVVDDPVEEPVSEASEPAMIDPLDFDPASADLILVKQTKRPASEPKPEPKPAAAPGVLLDQRLADQRAAVVDGRLAEKAETVKAWAQLAVSGAPAAKPTPPGEAMSFVLPQIELVDWPLVEAVDFVSNLTGAPITIDPAALKQANVSTRQRLTLRGRDRAVGSLLNTVLANAGLQCVDEEGHLRIVVDASATNEDDPNLGELSLVELAARLDESATFSFVTDTPLQRVVEHWRRALKAPILVDWAALSEHDLYPNSKLTAAVHELPWREALDRVLGDLGLRWHEPIPGVLQITKAGD